ncbi:MAG: ABC transporter substrate-binding protein [Rhodocyclales bacterium]|nr:ABC transporter substrate-binding protein [Rhodocyclales bacterium]
MPLRFLCLLAALCQPLSAQAACPSIVSQSPYITRALDWLGLGACIVGVSRYDTRDRPQTGGVNDPDRDMIELLEPQLMITSTWTRPDVWQAATPKGTTALRVGGFRGMAEVEAMLRDIGRAAGIGDIDARVDKFAADWRRAADQVGGQGRRVLLLSACSAAPYSFGRGTTLYELFSRAGFAVVADHDNIRNFRVDGPPDELPQWIAAQRPELLFAFKNKRDEACNAAIVKPGIPIVPLDGEHFMHPGPGFLTALRELREALPQ